jgi:hypothetical protein
MNQNDQCRIGRRDLKGKGEIEWGYVKEDGIIVPSGHAHNTISYNGADIMAKLLGGDISYFPKYMGFIFGNNTNPLLSSNIGRVQDWGGVLSEVSSLGASNILITPITINPSYAVDTQNTATTNYRNNIITFTGITGAVSGAEYGLLGPSAKTLENNDSFYHILLMARIKQVNYAPTYIVYSRATLMENSVYPKKIGGWQLGVNWSITFY